MFYCFSLFFHPARYTRFERLKNHEYVPGCERGSAYCVAFLYIRSGRQVYLVTIRLQFTHCSTMRTAAGVASSLNLQHSIDESVSQGPSSIAIATMQVSSSLNNFAIHTFLHLFNLRRNPLSAILLLRIGLIVVPLLSQPLNMCVLQEGDIFSCSCPSFLSIFFSFQVYILVTPTTPLVGL